MSTQIKTHQRSPRVCLTVVVKGVQEFYIAGRLNFVIKCFEDWKKEYIHLYKNADVDEFELLIEI